MKYSMWFPSPLGLCSMPPKAILRPLKVTKGHFRFSEKPEVIFQHIQGPPSMWHPQASKWSSQVLEGHFHWLKIGSALLGHLEAILRPVIVMCGLYG